MKQINLDWGGEPLIYSNKDGSAGLILRSYHYEFGDDGRIKGVTPVTRPVLERLMAAHPKYKNNPGMAIAHNLIRGGAKAEKGQAVPKEEEEKKETK